MKKAITITTITAIPFASQAQGIIENYDIQIFNICATIFVVGMFMLFILEIIKRIMEHRIKNKIVEKGIPENLATSLLYTQPLERGNTNFKWFAILAGLGVALTIIYYTQPLGIHSLAIMAFCLATSFLGYYLFMRSTENKAN